MSMAQVREFHEAFGLPINWIGPGTSKEKIELRRKLIQEEFKEVDEVFEALLVEIERGYINRATMAHLLKELADLKYVIDGTGVTFGLDVEAAEERVHNSNMSKLWEDGKPRYREDGKVLKGPLYHEPYLEDLV